MAHQPQLRVLVLVTAAITTAAVAPTPVPLCATCADFCEGKCSFDGPDATLRGQLQNITVFRLTPDHVTGLLDKDSGDAAGDVYFGLEEKITPMHCRHEPGYYKCQWLNGTGGGSDTPSNVYVQMVVEVDGTWGPYGRCNPDAEAPGDWSCAFGNPYVSQQNGGGVPDPQLCQPQHCPRAARSVGWEPKNVTHEPGGRSPSPPSPAPWPANGYELQTLVGGNWYSTPAAGRCAPGVPIGTGGCSWRVVEVARTINASCANTRVFEAARKVATCFDACPDGHLTDPVNPSDCWTICLFQTILGSWNATTGHKGMLSHDLVQPWLSAFSSVADGGCPDVNRHRQDQ